MEEILNYENGGSKGWLDHLITKYYKINNPRILSRKLLKLQQSIVSLYDIKHDIHYDDIFNPGYMSYVMNFMKEKLNQLEIDDHVFERRFLKIYEKITRNSEKEICKSISQFMYELQIKFDQLSIEEDKEKKSSLIQECINLSNVISDQFYIFNENVKSPVMFTSQSPKNDKLIFPVPRRISGEGVFETPPSTPFQLLLDELRERSPPHPPSGRLTPEVKPSDIKYPLAPRRPIQMEGDLKPNRFSQPNFEPSEEYCIMF